MLQNCKSTNFLQQKLSTLNNKTKRRLFVSRIRQQERFRLKYAPKTELNSLTIAITVRKQCANRTVYEVDNDKSAQRKAYCGTWPE